MTQALDEAGLTANDIDLIDAHASATPLGDAAEALAIASVLGDRVADVPVLATKGQHAHALGATGVWEIAVTLKSMQTEYLPKVVNFTNQGDMTKLAILTEPKKIKIWAALTNSSGFGGINSALALRSAHSFSS